MEGRAKEEEEGRHPFSRIQSNVKAPTTETNTSQTSPLFLSLPSERRPLYFNTCLVQTSNLFFYLSLSLHIFSISFKTPNG